MLEHIPGALFPPPVSPLAQTPLKGAVALVGEALRVEEADAAALRLAQTHARARVHEVEPLGGRHLPHAPALACTEKNGGENMFNPFTTDRPKGSVLTLYCLYKV